MFDSSMDPIYKRENIKYFRRFLHLNQRDFIEKFLIDDNGNPIMSVASYSSLENRGGKKINEVIWSIVKQIEVDSIIFSLPTQEFAKRIEKVDLIQDKTKRKKGVSTHLDKLSSYIADQIFTGSLKHGDKLESDRVLAKKLYLSRPALREALKVLEVLGMLDIRPGQGTYLKIEADNFFLVPLTWSLFLNSDQIFNILAIRNLLEIKAAELAASSKDNESLMLLHKISNKIHSAYTRKSYEDFIEADLEFHSCIAKCSGNEIIHTMINTIRNLLKKISASGMVDDEQLDQIYEEHQKITGHILAKNPEEAKKAMTEHLENSFKRYDYR